MDADRYHHGDLRRALLDAAGRVVERQGAAGVSLRAIAREAGVSHAAPYHHFQDRESLLAALAARGFHQLAQALETASGGAADRTELERLQDAGRAYVAFAAENPGIYRLMLGGLLSDRSRYAELGAATGQAFGVLLGLLGASAGEADDTSPNPVALAAWSTVHGLALLLIEGLLEEEVAVLGADEMTRQVTRVLGRGLRAYLPPVPPDAAP